MKRLSKIGGLICIGMLLVLYISNAPLTALSNNAAPSATCTIPDPNTDDNKQFVRSLLSSFGTNNEFELTNLTVPFITGAQLAADQAVGQAARGTPQSGFPFPIGAFGADGINVPNYVINFDSQRPFDGDIDEWVDGTKLTGHTIKSHSYRGQISNLSVAGVTNNSLVALYIQSGADQGEPFISGFFVQDVKAQQIGLTTFRQSRSALNWFFIEPLRPLLLPLVSPNNVFAPKVQDGSSRTLATTTMIGNRFPPDCHTHIIYPIITNPSLDHDSKNINFRMSLNPAGKAAVEKRKAVDPTQPQTGNHNLATATIPLAGLADPAFYDLYNRVIKDKTWYEGEEELINLVDAFWHKETEGPNQVKIMSGNAPIKLDLKSLQVWTSSLYSAVPTDAYSQLCQFAEDLPPTDTNDSPPRKTGLAGHKDPVDAGGPMIVHLMTGADLGNPPDGRAVEDTGDGFCPGSGCDSNAQDIVGMAEGIGGFNNPEPSSLACNIAFADLTNPLTPTPFGPASHHSVSQQRPDLAADSNPLGTSKNPKKSLNASYNGLLYQRFLLMAHEIGHNLGATHVSSTSIMRSEIDGSIFFRLDGCNLIQIQQEFGSTVSIDPCFKSLNLTK